MDLRCWMALAARSIATIGAAVNAPQLEVAPFVGDAARLSDYAELKALHWDAAAQRFADWGNDTSDVELVPLFEGSEDVRRVVTGATPQPRFVPHYGYVSLFPLLMGLIPDDAPELGQQLQLLRDPDHLWTSNGLRSLSAQSTLYGQYNTRHDAPYWRGAVWINVNYLALRALREYSAGGGPHAVAASEAAAALQGALLETLVEQYKSRGYLWEQYDDVSGQGKGSHPFTGWTALVTLVAAGNQSGAA